MLDFIFLDNYKYLQIPTYCSYKCEDMNRSNSNRNQLGTLDVSLDQNYYLLSSKNGLDKEPIIFFLKLLTWSPNPRHPLVHSISAVHCHPPPLCEIHWAFLSFLLTENFCRFFHLTGNFLHFLGSSLAFGVPHR